MGASMLWSYQAPGALAGSGTTGDSGPITVTLYDNFLVMATVGAPTGSSPVLDVHIDGMDAFGNWYADLCSPQPVLQFSGGSAQLLNVSVGIDAPFVAATAPGVTGNFNQLFVAPNVVRVRWVLSGTSPSFPGFGISLYGR